MYTVVDLKLPKDVGLRLDPSSGSISFFSGFDRDTSLRRRLVVDCAGFSWDSISVLDYVVGEKVGLRRSVLGVRITKGDPDYSGRMKRVDLTRVGGMIEDRKKSLHGMKDLWIKSSNLCQEVILPSGTITFDGNRQFEFYRNQWESFRRSDVAFRELLGTVDERSMYYQRSRRISSDFDGDTITTAPAPEPRYVNNQEYIAQVGLDTLAQAAAEIIAGERGTPPASRGPRPRNQRW